MSGEEVVAVERTGRDPQRLVRADGSKLKVVEILEYWRNPRLGAVASASMRTTEAYRLLVVERPAGEPREVTIRQYGGSHASAWHLRPVHRKVTGADLQAALRTAMVERARQAFARGAHGVSPADTVESLTFINQTEGFLLDAAGAVHHNVKFPAEAWKEILEEAKVAHP